MAWSQPHLAVPNMGPTDEIKKLQHRLLYAYGKYSQSHDVGVIESGVFDTATDTALRNIQAHIGGDINTQPGVLTYATKLALGVYVVPAPPPPSHVFFSVCGTGVPWSVGYPFDIGAALNPTVWYHQPIGYPATAFPMKPSYTAGVTELVRQLGLHHCETTPWAFCGYSQGAIVTSIVLQRVLTGDLQQYKGTFLGGTTFGNPMREEGHTLPGGVDPGGHGIVTPNLVNTPESVWDMADGKKMVGSPGNDLYTTCGAGENAAAVTDQEAVWAIVDNGNPLSLAVAVLELVAMPSFNGTVGVAEAAFGALDFFVVQGITPHTAYQSVQPIPGDSRDCWRVALDHIVSLAA